MNLAALGPDSRMKNLALGAGSLLDIGIYSLTWGLLSLDVGVGSRAEKPHIVATQVLSDNIDTASSIILRYPSNGRQGILTSTTEFKTGEHFCHIEGTDGYIIVKGISASSPTSFSVHGKNTVEFKGGVVSFKPSSPDGDVYQFAKPEGGKGFFWEADAVALEIAAGRQESSIMPHAETLRIIEMLDEIRRQGGAKFPQDQQ